MLLKRGSIVFIILVLSTLSLGSISSVPAGIFYQDLNAGDELLYQEHFSSEYTSDYMYWSELETDPIFHSYSETSFYEWDEDAVRSYNINWAFVSSGNYNSTTTSYGYYGHEYFRHESYDYPSETWFLDYENDYYWDHDDVYSYYELYWGMDVYNDTLNFDPMYSFSDTILDYTVPESYIINGIEQAFIVDVYAGQVTNYYYYDVSFFDISFSCEEITIDTYIYYVDAVNGFLLGYEVTYESYTNGYFYGYSSDLGCNVEIDIQSYSIYFLNGRLFETTAAFSPVMDASLPLVLIQNYPEVDNSTVIVPIEVILQDSSNDMMVEIYVNDVLYSTYHHMVSGYYTFNILVADLPFDGFYNYHYVDIVVYDEFNFEHNSSWWLDIYDKRYVIPDWPSWLDGPNYIEINENEELDVMFRINSDTSWVLEIFKDDGFGFFSYDYHSGYKTTDIWLWDYGLTVGDYYYKLQLIDVVNETSEIILHVHVNPADTPVIMGPTGDYYYDVGTGETLLYQFKDDNPTIYTVWLDGYVILTDDYYDGEWISIDLDSYISTSGTYHLMIDAADGDNYMTTIHLDLYANNGIISPPEILGPTGDYYYDVGTGETLSYQLKDDNPTHYKLWINGIMVFTDDYYGGEWISIDLDSYIFTNGTYHLVLEAFDNDGYTTEIHLDIYALGDTIISTTTTPTTTSTTTPTNTTETTETTETTDTQTIGIEAPTALIALLSVLSVSGLAIILKRRR